MGIYRIFSENKDVDNLTNQILKAVEDFLQKNIPSAQVYDSPSWTDKFKSAFNTTKEIYNKIKNKAFDNPKPSFVKESQIIINEYFSILNVSITENVLNVEPLRKQINKILNNFFSNLQSGTILPEPVDVVQQFKNNPKEFLKKKNLDELKGNLLTAAKMKFGNKALTIVPMWINKLKLGIIVDSLKQFLDEYNVAKPEVKQEIPEEKEVETRDMTPHEIFILSKGKDLDKILFRMLDGNPPVDPLQIVNKFPNLRGKVINMMSVTNNTELYKKFVKDFKL